MERRKFLKFAGLLGAGGVFEAFRGTLRSAEAGTWVKVGGTVSAPAKPRLPKRGFPVRATIAGGPVVIRSDGAVFSAGYNGTGEVGDNTTIDRSTFVQMTGISNAVAAATFGSFAVALRSDGNLFAIGKNNYGQLGSNTTIDRSSFVQLTGP